MNTYSRRSILTIAGGFALLGTSAASASIIVRPGSPLYSCTAMTSTPEVKAVDSDISFEQAYLDTTTRYHANSLLLTELALDDVEDERLREIAQWILDTYPQDLLDLGTMREDLFGDAELEEATREKMMIAMGGMESCSDDSHMNFLDEKWVESTWKNHENPQLAYASMLVLVMEMELHQHTSGEILAQDEAVHHFCMRMAEEFPPTIAAIKRVKGELLNAY